VQVSWTAYVHRVPPVEGLAMSGRACLEAGAARERDQVELLSGENLYATNWLGVFLQPRTSSQAVDLGGSFIFHKLVGFIGKLVLGVWAGWEAARRFDAFRDDVADECLMRRKYSRDDGGDLESSRGVSDAD
jgi:hypothetical protein